MRYPCHAILACMWIATLLGAQEDQNQVLLQGTVRIRYERNDKGEVITGHGTAFGVDLSKWGWTGHRYLLTAAHNVLSDDEKQPYANLKIELHDGKAARWAACQAVAWDEDLDVCLIKCGEDLSQVLELDDKDAKVGEQVVMAGSPLGMPVAIFKGVVVRRFERGTARFAAKIPFNHGDSGGPMASPLSKVVGMAVAGIPKDGDLDHEVGLFLPVAAIVSFLEMASPTGNWSESDWNSWLDSNSSFSSHR